MNVENDAPFIVYLNNLSGFTKINCLSEGGFSTVYSVKDKLSGDMYCIKSFEFDCSDPSKRKIFANYANKLFDLDFPSLIPHQFFSLVDLDNQYHPSFIYPFFSKQSLKININKLNNTHIMIILTGISEGLRYLHQNNFTHGALEPSNILLDDQFRPILTSFGLGKMISKFNSFDPQISNRGSFNYMPPNHSIQQSDDLKSDIYRFGLIIYFLLSKKDPYSECQKIIHIPLRIMAGSLPKIPDIVPNDFANFIYKCWSQVPQDRPNIQDVCKELTKLRMPNVDIEKVNEYKEFLKKEASVSFNEFKKSRINQVVQQQQSLVDQKQVNENKQFNRLQQEKEEQLRFQQEKEEQLHIQQEEEEQLHIQKEEQLHLQQFHIHQEKDEEELDFQMEKGHQLDQQQYLNQQEKDQLMNYEIGTKNDENNSIQEISSNDSAEDSLLSSIPKISKDQEIEYSQQVEFQKDDYEPPPLPSTFSDDEPMPVETQSRRKSSRVRKMRLNTFSESSSESESDSYSAKKSRSKRAPSKTSPSKSSPISTRSTNAKSKAKSKAKRKLSSKKEKRKDVEYDEYDDDDDIDIDLSKFQIFKKTSDDDEQDAMFKIDDDNESKIKDVISIQHPKKKSSNIKSDEYKFFENLSLSDEMKKLVELALSGDAGSQNELGIDLIEGKHGIPKNPKMSFKMLDRAVKNNNDEAMINLGRCYEKGIGTVIDYTSAFELYNSAFENSENESTKYYAASYLGHCFEEGIGCQVDKERAYQLYSFCFSKRIAIAPYVRCLLFGTGVESNPQAAYELICSFEESEDNGLTLLKGICYEFGLGIQMNISEAINCYNRAIDQGNNEAIVQLALLLLSMGITSSSKQNDSSNFSSISSFDYHINNSENILYPKFDDSFIPGSINLGERNDPIQLLIDASSHLQSAKIHLGDCYLRGVGVDIDLRAAIRNYSNAANQCSLEGVSRYNLYSIPFSTKNITQIKSAAESQNDLALVIYGRLLQKEIATECMILKGGKPEDEALNLFRIASDDKSPIGMCQYGKTLLMRQRRAKLMNQNELFEGLINSNYVIDNEIEKEAVSLIKKSSDLKYKGGLYNYGRYILESIGVIKVDCGGKNIILIKNNSRKNDIKIQINFDYLDSDENSNKSNDIDMDQVGLAYSYLRMAADLGNNNARVLLGRLMKYGTFLNQDPKGALKYFDLARRSGSKAGIYYYSKMIIEGIDNISNRELNTILNELKGSINWEKSSIRSKAMNLYGKCVLFGTGGLRINLNDVALYFKNASGYPFNIDTVFYSSASACINYGELLLCGTGVEKNKDEGIKCTNQALLLNENKKMRIDGKVLYKMGMAYIKGKEIKKDVKYGIDLLKIAAEKGNNLALLKCASFLMDGFPDILKENKAEAFRIYSFMAENDNDVGLLNAGKMLIEGIGVEKNEELGKKFIERAAGQKNAEALQIVGNVG